MLIVAPWPGRTWTAIVAGVASGQLLRQRPAPPRRPPAPSACFARRQQLTHVESCGPRQLGLHVRPVGRRQLPPHRQRLAMHLHRLRLRPIFAVSSPSWKYPSASVPRARVGRPGQQLLQVGVEAGRLLQAASSAALELLVLEQRVLADAGVERGDRLHAPARSGALAPSGLLVLGASSALARRCTASTAARPPTTATASAAAAPSHTRRRFRRSPPGPRPSACSPSAHRFSSACRARSSAAARSPATACGHLPRVGRPVRRARGQAALAQGHQLRAPPRSRPAGRSSPRTSPRGRQHPVASAVSPTNGGRPGQDRRQDRPQPEHVAAARPPCRPPRPPARAACTPACPARCPACVKGPARPAAAPTTVPARGRPLRVVVRPSGGPVAEHLGQPPVHDLHLAERPDHDVGRLQVAVDHAVGVGVGHRLADLLEDRHEPAAVGRRVRTGPASSSSRVWPLMSFMARNGRPSGSVPRSWTGGMPGCCSWPVMRASSANRRAARGVGGVRLVQHLDGDLAAQRGVGGAVDDAHAAAGDLLAQHVAPGGGC